MNLSSDEKLNELQKSNYNDLLISMVDILYKKHKIEQREEVILELINYILVELKCNKVLHILDATFIYNKLSDINTEQLINKFSDKLKSYHIDMLKQKKNQCPKKYIISMLNELTALIKYTTTKFHSTIIEDGEKKTILKYKFIAKTS